MVSHCRDSPRTWCPTNTSRVGVQRQAPLWVWKSQLGALCTRNQPAFISTRGVCMKTSFLQLHDHVPAAYHSAQSCTVMSRVVESFWFCPASEPSIISGSGQTHDCACSTSSPKDSWSRTAGKRHPSMQCHDLLQLAHAAPWEGPHPGISRSRRWQTGCPLSSCSTRASPHSSSSLGCLRHSSTQPGTRCTPQVSCMAGFGVLRFALAV